MNLQKIRDELFVKDTYLTYTDDPSYYGKSTSIKEVFYYQNEYGYVLYLPMFNEHSVKIFDPVTPSSFRWNLFNRQILFVPFKELPYKKMIKLHPKLDDYLIRFQLDFFDRYKKVFVESDSLKSEQYFLIRCPKNYVIDFDTMLPRTELFIDGATISVEALKNHQVKTELVNSLSIMPEFLSSTAILKTITQDNIDDIWKHWLASRYGDRLLDKNDHYYKMFNDDKWVDDVISHLVMENMIETSKPRELDPGLKKLLGID